MSSLEVIVTQTNQFKKAIESINRFTCGFVKFEERGVKFYAYDKESIGFLVLTIHRNFFENYYTDKEYIFNIDPRYFNQKIQHASSYVFFFFTIVFLTAIRSEIISFIVEPDNTNELLIVIEDLKSGTYSKNHIFQFVSGTKLINPVSSEPKECIVVNATEFHKKIYRFATDSPDYITIETDFTNLLISANCEQGKTVEWVRSTNQQGTVDNNSPTKIRGKYQDRSDEETDDSQQMCPESEEFETNKRKRITDSGEKEINSKRQKYQIELNPKKKVTMYFAYKYFAIMKNDVPGFTENASLFLENGKYALWSRNINGMGSLNIVVTASILDN